MKRQIMMVAGEPSGDMLGGRLMAALKELTGGDVAFTGVGGETMEAEGLESLFPIAELSVMGFTEIVPSIPRILRRIRETTAAALELKPHALVTIDTPAFSLRVSKRLAGKGFPLVHYVAPSVWAWRPGRAREIARFLDHVLALWPFEPPYFESAGLPCSYVGHPVVELGVDRGDGPAFRARHGIAAGAKVLAVLPGSRRNEIAGLLPVFAETLRRLAARFPDLRVVVPTVATVADRVASVVEGWVLPVTLVRGEAEKYNAFAAADGALAASGTVALELALAHVPTVVTYKTNALTAWFGRRLLKVDYVSPPNLILGRPAMPELLLGECRPDLLERAVGEILVDPEVRAAQSQAMDEVAATLASNAVSPSRRAAEVVLRVIDEGPRHRPR